MRKLAFALLTSVAFIPALANAQDTDVFSEDTLDTITVYGEKLPREISDVYSSVGVATSNDIENYQLDEIRDVFNTMANVRWFDARQGQNGIVIRGMNSEGTVTQNNIAPLISVVIDGATQSIESTRRGSRGTWDMKQVEVYRGPQSTLQGRNSLAGTVVLESKEPTFEFEAGLQGTLGVDERHEGAFYASGPITDSIALRVSGEVKEYDKDISYTWDDNHIRGNDRYRNLRTRALFEPKSVPEFSALLTASFTYDMPGTGSVNQPFSDRDNTNGGAEFREAYNNHYIAKLSYDLQENLTVESVSAYIDQHTNIWTPDPSAARLATTDLGTNHNRRDKREHNDFTQDLRFLIGEDGDKFSGVIGGFAGDFNRKINSDWTNPIIQAQLGLLAGGGFLNPAFISDVLQDIKAGTETENYAAYADLRYKLYGPITIFGGGRFLHESVRTYGSGRGLNLEVAEAAAGGNPGVLGALAGGADPYVDINNDQTVTDTVFLPKIGLAYEIDENSSLSVTASEGYRSGYVESINFDNLSQPNTVLPETLWSYELAYRYASADKKWNFGATGFYYDYTNMQLQTSVTSAVFAAGNITYPRTINAGKAESYGAEFEGRYTGDNGLSVFGSLGLLKTEFKDLNTNTGNFSGNEFSEAPSITGSLGAHYLHETGLFIGTDANYTGSYYSAGDIGNTEHLKVDKYLVVNARFGYKEDGLTATVYANNLFDKTYVTSLSGGTTTPTEASIANGREIGFTVKAEF